MFVDADGDDSQGSLFVETAKLSEMFFEQLKRHPVPIEESAIKSISNNSQAIDVPRLPAGGSGIFGGRAGCRAVVPAA
jgi:hypothetical protein